MSDETTRIILELPNDLLAEIKQFRFVHRLESRSDAMRRLFRLGLDAARTETRSDAA
jgi:metal-responsive CopG/Arc/MetJ family transcriptional regulator